MRELADRMEGFGTDASEGSVEKWGHKCTHWWMYSAHNVLNAVEYDEKLILNETEENLSLSLSCTASILEYCSLPMFQLHVQCTCTMYI